MDVRKALTYVQEHGGVVERARAETLVDRALVSPSILAELVKEPPTTVRRAGYLLLALNDLAVGGHPLAQQSLGFLRAQQDQKGGWYDPAGPIGAPAHFGEVDPEAGRVYTTAWVTSLLVIYGRAEDLGADRALDLLLRHQREGGLYAGFPRHTAWSALPLLAVRLGQRSGPAQNILLALGREVAEPDWLPSYYAAMLRHLLIAGYGLETPLVRQSWEQLLMRQRGDGSWESEPGGEEAVRTILDVLWCWRRLVRS